MTTKEKETTVVVGGGHAAGALLTTLIQKKYPHNIVLVGDEPYPHTSAHLCRRITWRVVLTESRCT